MQYLQENEEKKSLSFTRAQYLVGEALGVWCGVGRTDQGKILGWDSPPVGLTWFHTLYSSKTRQCADFKDQVVVFFFLRLLWIHKPLWTALHCYYFPSKPEYLCWYSAWHWYSIHLGFRFYMGACPCAVFITSVRKWIDSGKMLLFFSSKRWMSKLVV